jgi:hypothetical protein
MKIARRFNGGESHATTKVPGRGRLNIGTKGEKAFSHALFTKVPIEQPGRREKPE